MSGSRSQMILVHVIHGDYHSGIHTFKLPFSDLHKPPHWHYSLGRSRAAAEGYIPCGSKVLNISASATKSLLYSSFLQLAQLRKCKQKERHTFVIEGHDFARLSQAFCNSCFSRPTLAIENDTVVTPRSITVILDRSRTATHGYHPLRNPPG